MNAENPFYRGSGNGEFVLMSVTNGGTNFSLCCDLSDRRMPIVADWRETKNCVMKPIRVGRGAIAPRSLEVQKVRATANC